MNTQEYRALAQALTDFYQTWFAEAERLRGSIKQDKNTLASMPLKTELMQQLQFMLQQKNIAFFSDLISELTENVIQNKDLKKRINFDLSIKNSMPALRINALADNNVEDITSGGMKNVIATGLRVLSLWRLTGGTNDSHKGTFIHRKFLFLDEPDCWIAEAAMPQYAKLLSQLSMNFGIQILTVTHKNPNYFKHYAKLYHIEKTDAGSEFELVSEPDWLGRNTSTNYIKSFTLKNFKAFKHAELELSDKFTVITGKSDTGKSVVMEAFNALVNNQSGDEVIRHHENKATVNVKLVRDGAEENVEWERVRKTNQNFPQKVRYRLFDETGKNTFSEYNSFSVPDQIAAVLQMRKQDKVDIHLGFQDDMSFLFNPRITDQERAKILSLGKESSYVTKLMERLKSDTRELKSRIKVNETRYTTVREAVLMCKSSEELNIETNLKKLERFDKVEEQIVEEENQLLSDVERVERISAASEALQDKSVAITKHQFQFYDCEALVLAAKKLKALSSLPSLIKVGTELPKIEDLSLLEHYLHTSEAVTGLKTVEIVKHNIVLHDVEALIAAGKTLKTMQTALDKAKQDADAIQELLSEKKVRLRQLEQELGTCPLCKQSFSQHAH